MLKKLEKKLDGFIDWIFFKEVNENYSKTRLWVEMITLPIGW